MRMVIAITLLLVMPFTCFAQPGTPAEKIPTGIPEGIRQDILRLYSFLPADRAAAMERLGMFGEAAADAIPFLIEMLSDGNQVKRASDGRMLYLGDLAEDALVKIGEPAIEPLIKALKNDNWHIRAGAAVALGKTRNARAVGPLMDVLKDKDRRIEGWAAKGLGLMGQAALEPLIKAIDDEGYMFQLVARALGEIGDPRAIRPLVAALNKGYKHVMSLDVTMALGKIGEPAVEALIGLLESNDPDTRANAASALGPRRDKRATRPLFAALVKETYYLAHLEMFKSIGEIGDPEAVPPLAAIYYAGLTAKDDLGFRAYAVGALGKIGDPRAIEILVMASNDKDKIVREEAIKAMCNMMFKIKDERLIGPLIDALAREDEFRGSIALFSDIGRLLRDATGQDFGQDHVKWRQWWDKNKESFRIGEKVEGED